MSPLPFAAWRRHLVTAFLTALSLSAFADDRPLQQPQQQGLPDWIARQQLPPQWTVRAIERGALGYSRTGLPEGSVFTIRAGDVVTLGPNTSPIKELFGCADCWGERRGRWENAAALFDDAKQQQGLRDLGLDVAGLEVACDKAPTVTPIVGHVLPLLAQTCVLKAPGQVPLNVMFTLRPGKGSTARLTRVLMSDDVFQQSPLRDEMHLVLEIEKKHGVYEGGPSLVSERDTKAIAERKLEMERKARKAQIYAPGLGAMPGDYVTLLVRSEAPSIDGNRQFAENEHVYVLFKDGMAYCDLAWALEDFDAKASREVEPDRWIPWRRHAGDYQVFLSRNGQQGEWQTLKEAQPGVRDERLDNQYVRTRTAMNGLTRAHSIDFKPDGRFEHGSLVAGTANEGRRNPDGAVAGGRDARHRGTYRIDGWTLTLRRDDGVVERHLFLHLGDRLNIGGGPYLPR